MKKPKAVTITMTEAEANWLYDVLAEMFDEGASTGRDEIMCSVIADKIDSELSD